MEILKACRVAFMKARNSLVAQYREERVNWKTKNKKTEDGETLFLKASANRFWLTSKCYSWFSKDVNADLLSNELHEKIMICY